MMSNEWHNAMKVAFYEGLTSKSVLDNPYWKKYPVSEEQAEESRARHWVDGYFSRVKDEKTI